MNFIDLFSGAGGLSEGFMKAGFNPIAHDHSQKINRVKTYILGFIAPKLRSKVLKYSNLMPAKTFRSISFMDGKNEMQLWLNLNYSVELEDGDSNIKKIEFKLKSEIINQMGNRFANHISRIGITSF